MPPQTQKRRRTGHQAEAPDDGDHARRRRHPKRAQESDDESEPSDNRNDIDEDEDEDEDDPDLDMAGPAADGTSHDQLVKKLVRYALACEYARMPIRRDGIRDKVLGPQARSFRRVFDATQEQLQMIFGMEMVELPVREKRSLKDKQKAVKRGNSQASASSRQYVLMSTLPQEYRTRPVIGPSRIPSAAEEAAYVAFYTVIISIITLSSGELSDMKLRRYLTRLNATQNLPMDKTDHVLQKLIRQGYLDKVVERVEGDEDSITWCVGPRGKVEVSPHSIAQVVTEVWGELPEDFDKKLEKSLGVQRRVQPRAASQAGAEPEDE